MKVSAAIIAKDEADRIGPCLESLSFVDEIVVQQELLAAVFERLVAPAAWAFCSGERVVSPAEIRSDRGGEPKQKP